MIIIDPTTAAAAAASLLALDPVKKLLGPTADYIGTELAAYAKRRFSSAEKIIEIAAEHATDAKPDETVSARVLLDAIDEGSKVESEIAQKYFGGVLASSLSKNGEDDSSVIFTSMLSEMSSAQIKTHCALYSALRARWVGSGKQMGGVSDRDQLTTAINYSELQRNFGDEIFNDLETTMFGLYRLDLIDNFLYGGLMKRTPGPGIAQYLQFKPTVLGCKLFLAANGLRPHSASQIFDANLPLKPIINIKRENVFSATEITIIDPTLFNPTPPT